MSRVFDALQEAARRRGTDGTRSEVVWTELGIDPTAAPPEEKDKAEKDKAKVAIPADAPAAVVMNAVAMNGVALNGVATNEVVDVVESTEERAEAREPASQRESSANILLDKQARLIPHCADPIVVERYRMLRTKLLQEREKKSFRSLIVTSANPQEGKTVTVLNLALSFAALPSFKVLVIDGDMRKGTLGNWLGIDKDRPGLSNLIEGSAHLGQVLLKSEELSLHVIPRGNAHICDLQSSQFDRCFRQLSDQFDLVLIDTPPVNLITDVQIMAASADAILLIARAFATTNKSLEETVDKLQTFRIIGTVLNAGSTGRSRRYNGYY
jgi:capsular exopolysaccharide synthesis family protein